VRADAESFELPPWRHQLAVGSATMPHVLDHQKLDQALFIEAKRAPCVACE
jgi:hypothetical protein